MVSKPSQVRSAGGPQPLYEQRDLGSRVSNLHLPNHLFLDVRVAVDAEGDFHWDGHGVVTEGSEAYRAYVGRYTFETGPVIVADEPAAIPWGRVLFAIH